ncbi:MULTISPECIES: TMEM175 family protein [unclassified Geodermatophilus]
MESPLGFERLVFFSDAVYAIVITLLVLPLTAEIELPENEEGLFRQVLDLWPTVLTFAVSFLVIGQFWIAHHRTFGHVRRSDHGLLWFNLVALMTVAFMPFPAALLGSHSTADDAFPVVFYAASLTLASAALTATWLYAARRGLLDPRLDDRSTAVITRRAFATTAVFAASVGAAFVGLVPAVCCWLVVLPVVRVLVGREQHVPS